MLALLIATTIASSCATSPSALLDENRLAMGERPTSGTVAARYAYVGQGLTGSASMTFDVASGKFIDALETPPISDLHGFDGNVAWLRDLSGAFVQQGTNGRRAIAVSEAYVNSQAWWRKHRAGARIELDGCNALKVTPLHGNSFVARFDQTTKLLSSIRQTVSYGITTETRFSDYQSHGKLLVPGRIDVLTDDDPGSMETLRLKSFELSAADPVSNYAMPAFKPSDWNLPPSGQVTVPFRLLNNHVIIDAKVNGKGPFPFLLDTGGHDILTPSTLTALGLSSRGETPSGGGGEGLTTNGYVQISSIEVGGASLNDQTVVTLDFSPFAVEGIQLGGMLGLEFMERFVVRIDYGRRTVTIMDPKAFDASARQIAGAAIPFTFYEHMPQIAGTFDGRPARFDIDTGSRSDVTMTSPFVERESLRAAYPNGILATEGWGVGGPTRAYLVRAHSMKLGDIEVPGPIAGFSTAKRGALSDDTYDGNVGSGALKRFIVTFDYEHKTMYLSPATRLDPDTAQFDRAGMWLNLATDGLQVMAVAQDGPAQAAGLKAADVITDIDGRSVAGRSLSDIRSSLKTASVGQALTIAYQRAGRSSITKLIPRKLIQDPAPIE